MRSAECATSHRLDKLVADEAPVELRAGELELPVEVVGGLLVGVGQLAQHLLVVVHHVGPHHLHPVRVGAARDVEGDLGNYC